MQVRPGMEVAGLSDIGCQRENNEDCYSYWEPVSDAEFQRKGRLAIMADGMGGYEGGQEASRIAVEFVEKSYSESTAGVQAALVAAVEGAHHRILDQAAANPTLYGMGTTCTAIVVHQRQLYFAHVGDSRLYHWSAGKISRLTCDHSYVGRLVSSGVISPDEAAFHPQRHILTAALGAGNEITPEVPPVPITLAPADVLLLCTDGLWSVVDEAEIRNALESAPSDACWQLVQLARDHGGPDNITVQVLRVS